MPLLDVAEEARAPGAELSDEEALARSVARPSLFAVIIDRYQDALLHKALQVVKNREDAEDIVQEAFTKMYMHAGSFERVAGASFKSWAYKILLNTAFTHYERLKRRRGATVELSPELEAVLPDRDRNEFENLAATDYVVSVFSRMSDHFRRVLTAFFLEGKSQAEIAEAESISVGAVKTRMHRAKAEFRRIEADLKVGS